jgi:hypothetical protein
MNIVTAATIVVVVVVIVVVVIVVAVIQPSRFTVSDLLQLTANSKTIPSGVW